MFPSLATLPRKKKVAYHALVLVHDIAEHLGCRSHRNALLVAELIESFVEGKKTTRFS